MNVNIDFKFTLLGVLEDERSSHDHWMINRNGHGFNLRLHFESISSSRFSESTYCGDLVKIQNFRTKQSNHVSAWKMLKSTIQLHAVYQESLDHTAVHKDGHGGFDFSFTLFNVLQDVDIFDLDRYGK